ncbi:MAG TPA: hypothetical protein VGR26_14125 [Acidimicrobiales bacterium]|nr:hypothetical protein [Acidimicrobiales bacterium]
MGCIQLPASARHNFSMLDVDRTEVVAGEEIGVSGFSYTDTAYIRFGSVDGQILAELQPSDEDIIKGTVQIPMGAPAGRHVLYAVQQNADGEPSRFPGLAALTVVGPGGPPLGLAIRSETEARPEDLIESAPFSIGDFLTLALATVGALSLLTAAFYGLFIRRRHASGARP